jgi:hypothetical protein
MQFYYNARAFKTKVNVEKDALREILEILESRHFANHIKGHLKFLLSIYIDTIKRKHAKKPTYSGARDIKKILSSLDRIIESNLLFIVNKDYANATKYNELANIALSNKTTLEKILKEKIDFRDSTKVKKAKTINFIDLYK